MGSRRYALSEIYFPANFFREYVAYYTSIQEWQVMVKGDAVWRKCLSIRGYKITYTDKDREYIRRLGRSIKRCSLKRVDEICTRFRLDIDEFEKYVKYRENGGLPGVIKDITIEIDGVASR